jgi:hypothetical protein
MKILRVLALLVGIGFLVLLIVGFDNMLALLRSRVAIFLALGPLVLLFLWSVYRMFKPRKSEGPIIELPPRKE